ncbi:flagellar FlbD family protein [Marinisporobacter balticus]|uniref:Flagellar protein FlbD n=1 Tax=Marinisporobacter balticus TaxID=2018667 RepID=A0A4R2L2R6_9FIRM|nr:flagellar FlbD family protein [Marinisporobacter balticus]TCO79942.1 flagellar protein FlbD [Marinisporobacter balticus]
MIYVTRLSGKEYVINSDLIECIESTPDTVITLTTGKKIIVLEPIDEIINNIIKYKQQVFSHLEVKHNSLRNEV